MINKILVEACVKAFKNRFEREGVPYIIKDDEESQYFFQLWEETDEEKELAYRQAAPAIERIVEHEPYIFETAGEPLCIRLNYLDRKLERDSFGEIMLERADLDWRFAISVKSDARILTALPIADRELEMQKDEIRNSFNEIDDFGERIFGIPCSNEYFDDMNEILLNIAPRDSENWSELIKDDSFVYGKLITPMLKAIGREFPRILKFHPEAPQKLFDYFYGKMDYYYIKPIDEMKVTRIGSVNSRGYLGRIPDNTNLKTPKVRFPSDLLEVRFATGKYSEICRDTLQLSFDGGWSICINVYPVYNTYGELGFDLMVYLPRTPFGSYRDQVDWAPEA
ncbi:MAG: HaeIII family restriction endonuclease [Oscillospiraceae bacterium]|nr:HaeIII family restriction endonuclease [Oscillospiraceae bacterium]